MGSRRSARQLRFQRSIRTFLLLGALLLVSKPASAQRFAADARTYFDYGDQLYTTILQSSQADSVSIVVTTANALFSFLKSDRAVLSRGSHFAIRDIAIELRESPAGKVLATKNVRDTIFASEFSETTSKERWHIKIVTLPIDAIAKPKTIEVHTEVRDGFLSRLAERASNETILLRAFSLSRSRTGRDSTFIGVGDILLFDGPAMGASKTWRAWGATTEFSRQLHGAIPLSYGPSEQIDSISLTLRQISDPFQPRGFKERVIARSTMTSNSFKKNTIIHSQVTDSLIAFIPEERVDSIIQHSTAYFTIGTDTLGQGEYELTVVAMSGSEKSTITRPLSLVWHTMPLSLENPRDAVPPLQYVTTEEEYSDIASGSRDEQLRHLYEYWKKQDPTPTTAFNERLSEFYKRADYAYFNFAKNPRQLDGAMTDRGKIYILFGPPTNIQRSFLLGEQPVEIWTYSNAVKKVFKFIDPSAKGEYALVDIKPM